MEIGGISHTEEILLAQEAKLREQNNKNTIPHPADLVDQEACQSVSIGVPTLKAVNSKKPYF